MPIEHDDSSLDIQSIGVNSDDEVQEILGNPPGWLLQWGISIIFISIIGVLITSYYIKYPDILPATVSLTTLNPPIEIVPLTTGKIQELNFRDLDQVKAGDVIAIIESNIEASDVYSLERFIYSLKNIKYISDYLSMDLSVLESIGEFNTNISALNFRLISLKQYLDNSLVFEQISATEQEIKEIDKLNENLRRQLAVHKQESHLAEVNFQRNQALFKEGVISKVDLEQIENTYLQYKRQLETYESNIINNNISIAKLDSRILDLSQGRLDEIQNKINLLKETIIDLEGQIKNWKKQYMLISPISGKLSFVNVTSENQFVNANQTLFIVVPNSSPSENILARGFLPVQGSGEVFVGSIVNLSLDGFPKHEYGIIKCKVDKISLTPINLQDQNSTLAYIVEMNLPQSLITNYQKNIPFKQGMSGKAEIITEDKRFLNRIFGKLREMLD